MMLSMLLKTKANTELLSATRMDRGRQKDLQRRPALAAGILGMVLSATHATEKGPEKAKETKG
jgi:hypothetical protein